MKTMLSIAKEAQDSLLIEGVHGIGKSEEVKQWCEENGYHLKVLFTSLIEETDLAGIPTPDITGKKTQWLQPDWVTDIQEAAKQGKHTVLLLDELNRANPSVLNAALELVLNKEINGHVLTSGDESKRAFVCACVNPADDDYNVQDFDPALLDRFISYEKKPDAESWLQWAQENDVHPIIRRFIAKKPQYIHSTSETEKVTPTPRSWTKLSDNIKAFEKQGHDASYLYTVIKGKVGKTIGAEFLNFYNEFNKMISIDDIKDTAKKAYKKGTFEDSIEAVKKLIEGQEPAIILDFANEFFKDASMTEDYTEKSNICFKSFYHAAPLELIASVLKTKRTDDFEGYRNVAKVDRSIFTKILDIKQN